MDRHRHATAYAAIVIDGSFCETGDLGLIAAQAGDIIVHCAWEAHRDVVGAHGARVRNLPVRTSVNPGVYRSADLDGLLALADTSHDAFSLFEHTLSPVARQPADWTEMLVAAIDRDPTLSITAWAADHGLGGPIVSRGFAARYGISPKRFRAEAKARAALRRIRDTTDPFAAIALASGFSDQPHMTRAVTAMTGSPPARWRGGQR